MAALATTLDTPFVPNPGTFALQVNTGRVLMQRRNSTDEDFVNVGQSFGYGAYDLNQAITGAEWQVVAGPALTTDPDPTFSVDQ